MEIIIITGAILFALVLSSVLVLGSQWKYYKKVYKNLPYMKFKRAEFKWYNQVESEDRQFIWFANVDSFLLSEQDDVYLHNTWFTRFDPYSFYWWYKYRKYFNMYHLNKKL